MFSLGFSFGFAHIEFMLTGNGFEVIEVNPRLVGGLIGPSLCFLYDCNIYEAMIQLSLGERPALLDKLDDQRSCC